MTSLQAFIRSTATLCAIMTAGVTLADDGVVRMSDRPANAGPAAGGTPFVQVSAPRQTAIQAASHDSAVACADQGCSPQGCAEGNAGCCPDGNSGMCNGGTCYTPVDCNSYFSGCDATGMPMCWCSKCQSSPCQCNGGRGRNAGGVPVFAGSLDSGTGSPCRDFWHGQSMSFRNKNARLANHLFGWMIPSGCCGQGCPPVGKYQVTYSNQPDYIDPRDTQMYGAQGYGMPMAVPMAPHVTQAYNYSSGLPSSRITHIGNYNPQTSPQPLYHQTW